MRTSTLFLLAMSCVLPFATTACDDIGSAVVDGDDEVSSRCFPQCISWNSPIVGDWDISNFITQRYTYITLPTEPLAGGTKMSWLEAVKWNGNTWLGVDDVVVTETGQIRVSLQGNDGYESAVGTRFYLGFLVEGHEETGSFLQIIDEETTPGMYFGVHRYRLASNIEPKDTENRPMLDSGLWAVCPLDSSTQAVILPQTELRFDGSRPYLEGRDSTQFVWACSGEALADGLEQLQVLPNSGSTLIVNNSKVNRNYEIEHYNAITMTYLGYFNGTRTVKGTQIAVTDLAHNPPMFNTATTPPFQGWSFYVESVYNEFGANAFIPYSGYPNGVHRNKSYDPPAKMLDGWSDLPLGPDNLADHGSVAVLLLRQNPGQIHLD